MHEHDLISVSSMSHKSDTVVNLVAPTAAAKALKADQGGSANIN